MDFVIIANAWAAGIANPTSKHRIAQELANQGHRVLWVEGAGMRRPSLGSGSDRSRMATKLMAAFRGVRRVESGGSGEGASGGSEADGGIWVLSPLLIPIPASKIIRRINGWLCGWSARAWSRILRFEQPVLINYVPVLAEAMRYWKRSSGLLVHRSWSRGGGPENNDDERRTTNRCVYHCVDRWDAFAMYDSAVMARMDEACCRYADLVIASARDLYERCREFNSRVYLVSHGVDHAHFAAAVSPLPRPADLPAGAIVGFFGLLSEWLDQDLLVRLSRELSGAQFVLIGKADVPIDRLKGISNLHLLGPRPFRELPRYIAHFVVGIIPFVVNDLTRAVNPIKLREMLSAGCPVVSTDLPEVAAYGGEATMEAGPNGAKLSTSSCPTAAEASRPPSRSLASSAWRAVGPDRRGLNLAPFEAGPGARGGAAGAVDIARSHEEFVRLVRRRLDHPLTHEKRAEISRTMEPETWAAKVAEILRAIEC